MSRTQAILAEIEQRKLTKITNLFAIEPISAISRLGNGLINETFLVKTKDNSYVLQKLHKIFGRNLLDDTEVVTNHLKNKGFTTPILIKTRRGNLCVLEGKKMWRMQTFIPGTSIEESPNTSQVESAGNLMAQFHSALNDLEYEFKFKLDGFHDTQKKIEKLIQVTKIYGGTKKHLSIKQEIETIIDGYNALPHTLETLPRRIIHGDPKIDNILFDEQKKRAIALVDLDTVSKHTILVDIADAARSWCNKKSDDGKQSTFDRTIFEALLVGYLKNARLFITKDEIVAIPEAIETIVLELASRFATDAMEETYFRLEKKYPTLHEQNVAKTKRQLELLESITSQRREIKKIIEQHA